MQIKKVPQNLHWHEGVTHDIALGPVTRYGRDFEQSRLSVYVRNRETQKVWKIEGRGKDIGNFHPIWIQWKGQRWQVTQLLRNGKPDNELLNKHIIEKSDRD